MEATVKNQLAESIQFFQGYCLDFYNNKTGIYPIASESEVIEAVNQYLTDRRLGEIYFDSIDREAVRKIIEVKKEILGTK
jgi:hypothetical protein